MTTFTARQRSVYFIRPIDERGPVKVGCSNKPERRRQQLQADIRRPLELVAQVAGSLDDERTLHSLFWHDHLHGEWFNWSPYLQLAIDAAARGELDLTALPAAKVRAMPWRKRTASPPARADAPSTVSTE